MITIERALSIYTDKIIDGKKVDMDYFKNNLFSTDFIEFTDLIKYVDMLRSIKDDVPEVKVNESKRNELFEILEGIRKDKNKSYGKGFHDGSKHAKK